MQHSRLFLVSGAVQGVGYRAFARKYAIELGLTGYAKNLGDGRVEVLATGSAEALSKLSGHLRRGPSWSEVRSVEERDAGPSASIGFEIR